MANSRQQAIEAAERLFRAQGYAGTGLAQIIAESGSPKGSFYFNFPGGKHELALEALKLYGERLDSRIRESAAAHGEDPTEFVRYVCARQARELEASGWTLSCLAQQLANEFAPGDDEVTRAVARVMQTWIASMASVMRRAAASDQEATLLGTAFISGLSGARGLARVVRSKAPFEAVADSMVRMLRSVATRSAAKTARRRTKSARTAVTTH
ncbi:MAG TPA: TetR/AcrR family transcriptional regulator [Steroidobacteraceae bacterium]|jgi:TetR/AcrR family transcriptional repressor of lmrAB and yxaGH operons|nr:TetR/AcrR family transcriptional regulator [Steroidobacteraceae bacterium]